MWWCKKIAATLALCLILAGCGFQPMYGEKAGRRSVAAMHQSIRIDNIPDRDGQYLRNLLLDRLNDAGRPADARYVLQVAPLKKEITNQLVRKDATYTRALMKISTEARLYDTLHGQVVMTRPFLSSGSYNLLDNQFATIVSRDSMTDNLLRELSDNIVTAIDLHFARELRE
jgi:LPS-assembly lipoprotein